MKKKALKIKNRILKAVKMCAAITFLISACCLDSQTWLPTNIALISMAVYLLIDYGTFLLREERIEKAVAEHVD